MKKVIKLTESDLTKIVKRLVKESDKDDSYYENFKQADDYAFELYREMDDKIKEIFDSILNNIDFESIFKYYQNKFREKYGELADIDGDEIYNENISDLMNMGKNDVDYDSISYEMSEVILNNFK